jgi:hypothetical protein
MADEQATDETAAFADAMDEAVSELEELRA